MSVLFKFNRSQLMALLNEKGRALPDTFAIADVFAAITDGLIEPTMSDLRILGEALTRMGFTKRRMLVDGTRGYRWFKGEPIASRKPNRDLEPKWVGELLDFANKQAEPFKLEDALIEATSLGDNNRITMSELQRAGRALREAGYAKDRQMIDGEQAVRWGRPE